MAYNYDLNPWDDPPQQQQQHSAADYTQSGYSAGYSNPMAQYSDQTDQYYDQNQQQQYIDPNSYSAQGAGEPTYDQQQQQQQQSQEPSALRKFINQHVPICGRTLDVLSGINLPFIDKLVQHVNRDLLISKMFYFFFYSAFGSLFPLMGVYFKQLGMNPAQVGILTGVRPFIEIFSAPFWHSLADKFEKSKALLMFSLMSWIVFTYSLAHIRPPASACIAFNDTDFTLYTPYSDNDLRTNYYDLEQQQAEQRAAAEPSGSVGPLEAVKENKDEILASEENQNDQRRRRRRSVPSDQRRLDRYAYSLNSDEAPDLGVDLSSDFEDQLVAGGQSVSFFGSEDADNSATSGDDYDEMQQTLFKNMRRKKRAIGRSSSDADYESSEEGSESGEGSQRTGRKDEVRDDDAADSGVASSEDEADDSNELEVPKKGDHTKSEYEEASAREEADKGDAAAAANGAATAATEAIVETGESASSTSNQSTATATQATAGKASGGGGSKRVYKQRHKTPPTHIVGMSPITVEYAINYNKEKHKQFVTPMFSTVVYKLDDIKEVFFLLLLLISLGEFFSAPALTLADSATLGYLGDNTDLYGRQRMFGSFSWAVTLLLVGMALDNATSIADHPCGPHQRERSYTVCFVIFSLLMACALLTATQFRFSYRAKGAETAPTSAEAQQQAAIVEQQTTAAYNKADIYAPTNQDDFYASTQPRSIFNTAPPVNAPPPTAAANGKEKFELLDRWKSAVFAQRTWELPGWVTVFRQFSRSPLHLTYLFITWFLGCGVGLVFTFLFWHLQDVGGTPTLFGICSVINHISEILAYFFSFNFIKRFGHTKVSRW